MRILAADTCTSSGSIAFLDGEQTVLEWTLLTAQTHNRRLLKTIHSLLHEAGWTLDDIDAFAVTRGPGSFTGLRIGLTTLKTLAWALGKPFIAVTSLEALAAPFALGSLPVCSLLDAQKQQVYWGRFLPDGKGSMSLTDPYEVLAAKALTERISARTIFCGNGWMTYGELLKRELGELAVAAPSPFHLIRASFVAQIAASRLSGGQADDPASSVPLYIRPSEAELHCPRPAKP